MVKHSGATYLQNSGSGSLVRLHWSCWLGLSSSEGFTEARRFSHKMAHSHGCWPLYRAAWMSLWHGSWLPSEWVIQERVQGEIYNAFYDLISKVTHSHFHYILFVRRKWLIQLILKGRGICPTFWRERCQVICEHILEPPRRRMWSPLPYALVWHGTK